MAPQISSGALAPSSSPESASAESRKRKKTQEHEANKGKKERRAASHQEAEEDALSSSLRSERLAPRIIRLSSEARNPPPQAPAARHQESPITPTKLSRPHHDSISPALKPVAFAGFDGASPMLLNPGETPKAMRAAGRVDAHKSRVPGEEGSQGDHVTSYAILERFVEHVCSGIHIETEFEELREKLKGVLTKSKIDDIAREFQKLIDQDSKDHLTRGERKLLTKALKVLPAVKEFLDKISPSHQLPEKEMEGIESLAEFVAKGKLPALRERIVKGEKKSAEKIAKNMKDFILTTINKTKMVAFFPESDLGEDEKLALSRKHKKEKEKTSRATQILIYADILFGNENITFGSDVGSSQKSRSQVFNKKIGLEKNLKDSDAFKQKIKTGNQEELAKKIGLEIASNFMEFFDFDAANNICKKNVGDDSTLLKLVARHIAMCFNAFPNFTTISTDRDFEEFRKTLPEKIFDSCIKIVFKREKGENKDILLKAIASATVEDPDPDDPELHPMDTDPDLDATAEEKKLIKSLKEEKLIKSLKDALKLFIDPSNYSTILEGALYDGGKHKLPSSATKPLGKSSPGLDLSRQGGAKRQ